jgi:catechol 2,3-dioxygenase-like lactoylglutathione lyase family enzyme
MFDHVKFGVSDYAATKAFFVKALEPLGVTVVQEGSPMDGVELSPKGGKASLCLYQNEEKPAPLHLAFTAENRQQVEAFYRAAMEAGGKDNGAPGLCSDYHASYYAAFVIDPDGHNIEVVSTNPSCNPFTRICSVRCLLLMAHRRSTQAMQSTVRRRFCLTYSFLPKLLGQGIDRNRG